MTDPLPPERALATLRDSQDRVLEQEGIPMVLALFDERGPAPAAADPAVLDEGRRLAAAADAYRAALVPSSRDDDLGCLISVLQAVSFADFGGGAAPLSPADVPVPSRRVEP